mgnify:CR=1 FL=1
MLSTITLPGFKDLFRRGEGRTEVFFTYVVVDPLLQLPRGLETVLFFSDDFFRELVEVGIIHLQVGCRGEVTFWQRIGLKRKGPRVRVVHSPDLQSPGALLSRGGELVTRGAGFPKLYGLALIANTELVDDFLPLPAEKTAQGDGAGDEDFRG